MKFIYSLFLLVLSSASVFAQAGNYRTLTSGNWNTAGTWERDADSNGTFEESPSTVAPTTPSTAGTITIQNSHTVTVAVGVSIDQTTIQSGGTITVNSTFTLTLNNGAGNEITVNTGGTLNNSGTINFVSLSARQVAVNGTFINNGSIGGITTGELTFNSGGTYFHDFSDGGTIPTATWNANSNTVIRGYGAGSLTPPSNRNQNFGNFTWSCSGQDSSFDLTSQPASIQGNFTIDDTGSGNVIYASAGTPTFNIGGNFVVNAGTFAFSVTGTAAAGTINLTGSLNVNGGFVQFADDKDLTLNIGSNFSFVAGDLDFSATTATTNLFLKGNFTQTGGNLFATAGILNFNFNGTSLQTYSSSTSPTGTINYLVDPASTISLDNASFLAGTGAFTLGGIMGVGSTNASGAIQTGTSNGNIRVSGTRTYSSGSKIIYNGSAAQFMGNGHPSTTGVNCEINNSSGVSLATNSTIGGNLVLTSGNLSIGTQTLTIVGSITPNSNFINATTSSNITINGTGAFGTLPITGSTTINNFVLNRSSSGSVTLGTNVTIGGTFTQTAGDLDVNGHSFQISGAYTRSGGNLLSNSSSTVIVDGSGTLPATFPFGSSALNTLTLNRASSTLTSSASLTLTNLNLSSGTFNNTGTVTMSGGGIITRMENGSMSTAPVTASSYNVVYNISAPINTGVELPTGTTQLNNLTKQGSDVLTLNSAITVNGILTLTNGSFNAGSNAINVKGNFISNAASTLTSNTTTFSGTTTISGSTSPIFGNITITGSVTPSIPYGVNGALTNNGTLSAQSVTFTGVSSIVGSSASPFIDVTISSGTLTAPSTAMNVSGNFLNSGTFSGSATGSLNVSGTLTNNGTFTATSGAITVTGDVTNGGAFTATSGLMTLAGNFVNNSTFTHNGGTVVFNGTTSVSGSSNPNFKNITISGVLNSPSTLAVAGNFTNNNTFNRNTGTVLFNGSSIQQITGSVTTDFNHITITNVAAPTGVEVQHNENLRGVLTLSSNVVFDADGSSNTSVFTLISTADQPTSDAGIATLPSGASVSGKVTAQRYMSIQGPNSARIYRYISSPVLSATAADLQNEIPITGTFTTPSSCVGCVANSQSMWSYNEAVAGSLNLGYIDFPSTTNTEPLVVGKGYDIYVRGNVLSTPVWDLTGTPNQGTINFNVSYTSSGSPSNDGWNLVGNPYPSTIDWNAASGWTKSNLSNTIYLRDNSNAGSIATWNGVFGTNGGSRYIAMGQGFWVQTSGSSPSLIATESVKSAGTSTTFFREQTPQDFLRITLVQGSKRDESVINFRSDATAEYDNVDAWKWKNNTIFNLSTITPSGIQLAINSLPSIDCSSSVKLDISDVKPGNYSLEFSQFESFNNSVNILLNDKFTNKTFDVRSGAPYLFTITSNAASFNSGRFSILFTLPNLDPQFAMSAHDVCSSQDATITLASKQGFKYAIYKGAVLLSDNAGTGSDLRLAISKDMLEVGTNSFTVKSYSPACSTATIQKTIAINTLDIPQITDVSPAKNCLAGSVTLTVSSTFKGNSYHWYDSESSALPIASEIEPTFKTPVLQKSKTYYVSAANSIGCESVRKSVLAEIIQFDPVYISQEAASGALASSYSSGNQWYLDDQLILDANQPVLIPISAGAYSVKVDLGNGCTTTAKFITEGLESQGMNSIKIYPNPVLNTITVSVEKTTGVKKSTIVNTLGQEVGEVLFDEKDGQLYGEFDMSNKPAGVYLLKLDLQNGQRVHYNLIKK